jgi:DNA-binding CsgD family transcriptional regulator
MSPSPRIIDDSAFSPLELLSERELEVLELVAAGLSNRQIATELFLALGTVKTHIHNIFSKLDVSSRTQAMARSQDLGLVKSIPPEGRFPENDLELENPYKGLRAFREEDTADFFGREALIGRLTARLCEPDPLARFLAVVGPSGSGKSSVIKAGLIPALRSRVPEWQIVSMLPGASSRGIEIALSRINTRDDLHAHLTRDARTAARPGWCCRIMSANCCWSSTSSRSCLRSPPTRRRRGTSRT